MINKERIEQLLVQNWTKIIDSKKLFVLVLTELKNHHLPPKIVETLPSKKTMQISVSRLSPDQNGIVAWVEFVVPNQQGIKTGTCEYRFNWDLTVKFIQIIGHTITKEPTEG
jgi:hypothetical protein